ncbi:DUF1996 domain-containing protein [Dactylosporangium sp. AC04546]|uniref:DUF1996 domain-containing protein n=1 Tax=Dactylosporangium sp. AC04546 TaxID=2862460 RepID=UPI001EDEFCA2|nr:DUF1996 domain-containing protein [Dactylosporangium sp. AC04546]WVK82444.1 DUF1996 domain-containing protein [Dactylosporangium sp. AC04546]
MRLRPLFAVLAAGTLLTAVAACDPSAPVISQPPPASSSAAPSSAAPSGAPPSPAPSASAATATPQPVRTFTDKPPQAQYREFAANCTETHRAGDDPIVFPGLPGAAHDHTFVGNPATTATSTPESLLRGRTSCQDKLDASSYWFPTLYQNGTVVQPQMVTMYYKSGVKDYRTVQPFPAGFRLVVGDVKTASAEQFTGTWSCTGYLGKAVPASCPAGSSLIVRMQAPSCWDGVHLDSADHKSHMAWPVGGVCPKDHPVPLPMFELKVPYKLPGGNTGGLRYSSGEAQSFHYDFMNGWDAARQAQLVAHCVNGGRQCNGLGVDQHQP